MIALSQNDPLTLTLAFAAGAGLYFGSAALFRRSVWLYPGLMAAHLALATYFTITSSGRPTYYITMPFLGMTWLVALVGYWFNRRSFSAGGSPSPAGIAHPSEMESSEREVSLPGGTSSARETLPRSPSLSALLTPSWAQPFFIFIVLDLVFWQSLALYSFETTIILAVGNAVLLGLFAMLWQDGTLAYGTLAFFMLALGHRLSWAGLDVVESFAWVSGIAFGLYLWARVAEWIAEYAEKVKSLTVWIKPLTNASVFLTGISVIVTLPTVASQTVASAAALAFAGALYLAVAYRGSYPRLGYLGMGMLQLAWVLVLIVQDIKEPQWYAIPAGLYFIGVGFFERQRKRGLFAIVVEGFGLAVLLVTSFIQSLNGAEGFPYFVLLLVEGLVVIWWGASQRLQIPFFAGLGASVLNVVAQVVVLVSVYDVNRWFIFLGVGMLLVTVAVFVERQRESIISRTQEWREGLESWE